MREEAASLVRRGIHDFLAAEAEQWNNRGYEAWREERFEEAAFWYRKAANQGDADAQFMLGAMYEEGRGVTRSGEKAVYWYRKSVDQGDVGAQIGLGWIYEAGEIVPQDYAQAAYWYLKVADLDGWEFIQCRLV